MTFEVPAEAYDRFMGRYSEPLSDEFLQWISVQPGQRVLDVGCGPGALTARLVDRLGPELVFAADPSASFVEAARRRLPGVAVAQATAEHLPYPNDTFDLVLAQLVVHFLSDPIGGLTELARVARPDGMVAASTWDFGGGRSPLWPFWRAVREFDPTANDESEEAGAREGQLMAYFQAAGLRDVVQHELSVTVSAASFDEWWQPLTLGVGPAGAYLRQLDTDGVYRIRRRCAQLLPGGPFSITATAWAARGTV